MKRLIQKSLFAIPVLVLAVSILLSNLLSNVAGAAGSGSANVYLSPASGNYTVGDTVSINVYEDSGPQGGGGDGINAAQINLSYNASLLTFSSINSSAAFGVTAPSSGGGGTVQIGRGAFSPVYGPQVVATVIFTASAPGSAAISFAGGTAIVRSSDNGTETLTTTNGTYTINAAPTPPAPPPPPPPPSGGTTPPASPSTPGKTTPPPAKTTPPPASPGTPPPAAPAANPTANPTPPPATTGTLAPSGIAVTNLTDKTATISWNTSVPTTSEVDYGLNTQYGFTAVDSKLATSHSVVLSSKILIADTKFHYMVKGLDAGGQLIASGDKTFATAKVAKKSAGAGGTIIAAVVVLGLLAAGGGTFWWFKKGSMNAQWSGFEPVVGSSAAPSGQMVKPAGSEEIKPGENIIKPGGPPPA